MSDGGLRIAVHFIKTVSGLFYLKATENIRSKQASIDLLMTNEVIDNVLFYRKFNLDRGE